MGSRRIAEISKSWLQECREILLKTQNQVRLYLGEETPEIKKYASFYHQDLARDWAISDWDDVFTCLYQVDVALGGDFHPFAQSQRAHLRLLRKIVGERQLILALECVNVQDQSWVDQYLAGSIDDETFLKQVNWEQVWGFPWTHYRPLFEFARKNQVRIVGLNIGVGEHTGQGLEARDHAAAKIIRELHETHDDHLIYAVYGDWHIAENHLPRQLDALGGKPMDVASIYLNSEEIYFSLAQKDLEARVEVVRFNDRQFCLLTSPPWVKWHSYLMYLEENFDVDLEWDEADDEEDFDWHVDHTDHVRDLVRMIAAAIEVSIKVDDIEVYSLGDPQAHYAVEKMFSNQHLSIARALIRNDMGFYLPHEGFFYLSKSTVNHAASLAGQFVHAKISSRDQILWSFPDDFKKMIWVEAMAFLLSKFINPKRKSQSMADLKKQLEAFDKRDHGREPLLLALDQKMVELLHIYSEKRVEQTYVPVNKSSYLMAAKFSGEIVGDRFFKLYQKKIIDIIEIRSLLQKDLSSKDFDSYYMAQLKKLDQLESEGIDQYEPVVFK